MATIANGFAFLPEHERQGFGYESAKGVLDHGRTQLSFHRVLAITTPGNEASEKLLEKLGFVSQGPFDLPGDRVNVFAADLRQRLGSDCG